MLRSAVVLAVDSAIVTAATSNGVVVSRPLNAITPAIQGFVDVELNDTDVSVPSDTLMDARKLAPSFVELTTGARFENPDGSESRFPVVVLSVIAHASKISPAVGATVTTHGFAGVLFVQLFE